MAKEFIVIGDGVTASVVDCENGQVVVIDTQVTAELGEQVAALAATRGQVAYVINTHEHHDHVAGNRFFAAPIVSSHLTREALERTPDFPYSALPTITFSQRMTLYVGGEPIELHHIGGHCPSATVVYFPRRKLLFTGDLVFNGRLPFMGVADLGVWIQALHMLASWEIETVVPGHGPVGSAEILTAQRHWLEAFVRQCKSWRDEGMSKELMLAAAIELYNPPERWHQMMARALELALNVCAPRREVLY